MIVFAGPSLAPADREGWPAIDWRPPAMAGDLIGLVERAPAKVLLLDGLFDTVAAVMHKEALALMAAGTRLYGAASMGALRAAELAPFGMRPLGRIAAAYRSGLLVGDDEVALVHGDARLGWRPASVPMVEVRATLVAAVRARRLDAPTARRLRAAFHAIHYVDREWPVMRRAAAAIAPEAMPALERRHLRLKQVDARHAVAAALADETPAPVAPPPPPPTLFLERLREGLARRR
ncbi:TfuA domain-containing protein [Sphingomicrobium astaxanthinifaciens]|uniref:TfuA domain-containing protein n=1 Tax=Sphingomicrobium astaxanthinifaciens TaxID=1227949 RepID=UPI001FCC2516|nr:TfuA domain-containing protein [Sphingomicrobium astaxanthinifaciens]MCJ7420244.1 TfuA domain-containing protein [Sphingomicrobium astaxanthinifaciens]